MLIVICKESQKSTKRQIKKSVYKLKLDAKTKIGFILPKQSQEKRN